MPSSPTSETTPPKKTARSPQGSSKRQAAVRAKAERLRKEQQAKRRRKQLLLGAAAVVVVLLVAAGIVVAVTRSSGSDATSASTGVDDSQQIIPSTPTGQTTKQSTPATVTNTTGIDGVVAYDTKGYPAAGTADAGTLAHDHVTGPVTYAVTPPVGGPHNGIWMNAGVYTKPVPSERAVHDMEHGAVWITYRPDLPAAQVETLFALVGKQSFIDESAGGTAGQANRYMDLTPWASDDLPSPIVISSWGYQLKVSSPSDPRLQKFIDTFRHSPKYTPEYGSAVDGVPIQTGGRPATDGSKLANPAGTATGTGS